MFAMSAKSAMTSRPIDVVSAVWCGPPADSHASAAVARSGRGRQTARATGSLGSGSSGATMSTSLAIRRKRSPRSAMPTMTAGPGRGVEHEPHGVAPAADRQRVDLAPTAGSPAIEGHTSSMCAPEHLGNRVAEVVGVVLHERGPARQAVAHDLEDPHERGGLPVPLGAEAVAVGHQPLDADARQLLERAEVLERVRERREAADVEERPQTRLDAGRRAQLGVALARRAERRRELVRLVVGVHEAVDLGLGDGRRRPRRDRRRRTR